MLATELIASIKRKAFVPLTQVTFSEAEILAIAHEELLSFILPLVHSVEEDYNLVHELVDLDPAHTNIRIPDRAAGGVLREVAMVNADGTVAQDLPRVNYADLQCASHGFALDGSTIHLIAPRTGTLRLSFILRPSKIVLESAVGTCLSLDRVAKTVTLAAAPPAGFSSTVRYDLVRSKGAYDAVMIDAGATLAGSVLTFDDIPIDFGPGDFVTLADTSPAAQVVRELQPLLAQAAACRLLDAMGDLEHLGPAQAQLQAMEARALKLISNRVIGEPEVVVNKHSPWRC